MKIERKQLLNDLQDFAWQGDGVIIGSPGVGKNIRAEEAPTTSKGCRNAPPPFTDRPTRKWHP